jgi:hypothetical protein
MTDDHKAKLAEGRTQSRAVRRYLEAIEATRPKRGRKRTADSVKKRLAEVERELASASPLKALNLRQERRNLETELEGFDSQIDIGALEKAFVAVAKSYGDRGGISYAVWREQGVSAEVLAKAGITR